MSRLSILTSFLVPIVFLVYTEADLIIKFHAEDIKDVVDEKDMPDMKEVIKSINMTDAEEQCNHTFNINKEFIQSLIESGSFPEETNKMPKCYVKCLLETLHVLNEDGEINTGNAIHYLNMFKGNDHNETVISNIATKCAEDRDETDKCEKSYGYARCVMEDIIEMLDD